MPHTPKEKKKLLNRVRRINGQVRAIEKAIDADDPCSDILHNISVSRGAMDSLMAAVVEGHIRHHVLPPKAKVTEEQARAAEDLVEALRTYLK